MVNNPLIRPYYWGVWLWGGTLGPHDFWRCLILMLGPRVERKTRWLAAHSLMLFLHAAGHSVKSVSIFSMSSSRHTFWARRILHVILCNDLHEVRSVGVVRYPRFTPSYLGQFWQEWFNGKINYPNWTHVTQTSFGLVGLKNSGLRQGAAQRTPIWSLLVYVLVGWGSGICSICQTGIPCHCQLSEANGPGPCLSEP